jgi:hypothetical protein
LTVWPTVDIPDAGILAAQTRRDVWQSLYLLICGHGVETLGGKLARKLRPAIILGIYGIDVKASAAILPYRFDYLDADVAHNS